MSAARARLGLALAVIAVAAGVAACGTSSAERPETVPVEGVGESIGGSVAPLAQCRDWRAGSVEERWATIADIRGQLTPQTSPDANSGFSDDAAYDLFQRVCARDYASAYRLYKLYSNRAGFEPLVR